MGQEGREGGRFEDGTETVIGALIEVHRTLGPGLLESAYEACLCAELSLRGIRFDRQRALGLHYKGLHVDCGYRLDLVIEDEILLELKTVERLLPIHEAQVVTYLRLGKLPVGLLVNFNVCVLKTGLRRLTPEHPRTFRPSCPKISARLSRACPVHHGHTRCER
jgi:GxxExxY protein